MTPIYSNGTWGRVVAVEVDGERINRPIEGATHVESVEVEIGEVEIPCPVDEYEPTTTQVIFKVVADAGTHTLQHEGYDDMEIVLGDLEFSHTQEVEIVSPVPTGPLTLNLGRKTFTRTVVDADPRWAELEFADGFLDDVPQPPPEPQPDWPAFRLSLASSPAYLRITSSAPSALVALLTQIAFLVDSQPEKMMELAQIWNAIATIASPTEQEIASLNAIGTATLVPFSLNAQGRMGQ